MGKYTQCKGLNSNATKYLHSIVNRTEPVICNCCNSVIGGDEIIRNVAGSVVTGAHNDETHMLFEYPTCIGLLEEYVQTVRETNPLLPKMFLALRDVNTKEPIPESLWSEEDIDNA